MKLSIIKTKKFHSDIIETVYNGEKCYYIQYHPINHYTVLWNKCNVYEFNVKHLKITGFFFFNTVEDANDYLNGIEQPEEIFNKYDILFCDCDYHGITVYPKGYSLIKKFGYFRAHVRCGNIAPSVAFHFHKQNKYGSAYRFNDDSFFGQSLKNVQDLITNRHLTLDDKAIKRMTIMAVSNASITDVKKISNEISSLHNELETFYSNQNK